MQVERAHEHTHSLTTQPEVAGRSRNPSSNSHTHTTHPSQEWRGASEPHTRAHTQPNTPGRSGGAQPKPEPKHTHPRRTAQPREAGYRNSTHISTHTPQHPSQEWRGEAETRVQTHAPTPHTPARSGGVQAQRAHRTLQPGVAGCKRSAHMSTHTAQQRSQEWRGAAKTRAQAHTPKPHTRARRGGVQEKHTHQHTHTPTTQPGVAGRSRNPNPNTHTNTAHPSQEWRGTRGGTHTRTHTPQHRSQEWRGAAETQAQTHTPTARFPARSGGLQAERPHQHTHTPKPQPVVGGCSQNRSPNTHTHGAHPSQEWRGAS